MSSPVEQLKALIEFRKGSEAPVDTMGCSKLGDTMDPKLYRFQTLIALMLSAQTKDQTTSQAIERLKEMKGGLTPTSLGHANIDVVKEIIRPVSFYQNKADRIIEAAQICERDYNGDIPRTLEDLLKLRGVGMKMATLCMGSAWNEQIGIGVDVHVHRISNRLGWVNTKNPDATEVELQKVFPKELWEPLNETIVGFGQTICNAKKPKCELCPISESCAFLNSPDIEDSDEKNSQKKKKKQPAKKKNTKQTRGRKIDEEVEKIEPSISESEPSADFSEESSD